MDSVNGWGSNGTWESNSPLEKPSDEGFEIVKFESDRDDKLSEYDCLQSNRIDLAYCDDEKWRLLGCHIDHLDGVVVKLD